MKTEAEKTTPTKRIRPMKKNILIVALTVSMLAITGCNAGKNVRANSYTASQANQKIETSIIKILAISPAQVLVDNSEARETAQLVGGVLGALLGATSNSSFRGLATGGGAIGGAALGSMVGSDTMVDGVQLSYREGDKLFTSVQVGELCEFKIGEALVLSTGEGSTRVQPNATCPEPKT